jgi:hypothetical protein
MILAFAFVDEITPNALESKLELGFEKFGWFDRFAALHGNSCLVRIPG